MKELTRALETLPADQKISLSPCSDPYTPEEEQHGITRLILEELHRRNRPYFVCTKGTLVTRDIDLLSDYSVDHDVWMVLGALDEKALSFTEPGAPSPQARIAAMYQLVEAEISLTVNAAPLLPWITPAEDLYQALPHCERIHMCPLQVQHMGGKIKLFDRIWTQAELSANFFAARAEFTPRDNVTWHDPMPDIP